MTDFDTALDAVANTIENLINTIEQRDAEIARLTELVHELQYRAEGVNASVDAENSRLTRELAEARAAHDRGGEGAG